MGRYRRNKWEPKANNNCARFTNNRRLYDKAFDMWLESGVYASRPPFELHGPFIANGDVIILESSYLSQKVEK